MDVMKIVRAWKDAAYRESLSAEEQALLPENPAEAIDLDDTELDTAAGASWSAISVTLSLATFLSQCPSICVHGTSVCGTCAIFTNGCCQIKKRPVSNFSSLVVGDLHRTYHHYEEKYLATSERVRIFCYLAYPLF